MATAVENHGCPTHVTYCDTFSHGNSGWPIQNAAGYYADYDPYLGGTYRVGTREDHAVIERAPKNITTIAADSSVQLDADVTVGSGSPKTGLFGLTCWDHPAKTGQAESAFSFVVGDGLARVVLWDDYTGAAHTVASRPLGSALEPSGRSNHLTAQCIQGTNASTHTAQAQLALSINGTPAVSAKYDQSVRNWAWSVSGSGTSAASEGSYAGVLTGGSGEDVFVDNFAITSRCRGDFC